MLDAFTSSMCSEPWGRMGYDHALIEISVENELKNEIKMAVPIVKGEGHTIERMRVEYEWKPPRGDRYPFNLSKPLPLQGYPGHLTVAADYFFNNDLEYLKSSNTERTYTTSITKTKAARYELKGLKI
ncbi:hypothetical protein Tco_0346166, partial [Tanacetum coccineum]